MKATRWISCFFVAAFSVSVSAFAQEIGLFQYSRPIELQEKVQEELFAVPLDSDVCAATRDGFPDLRIFDTDHRLVPFLIRTVSERRTRKVRKSWTATNPVLKPLDENGMEIHISLAKEDPAPRGLRFLTPLRNFEQQVRVFAISDGAEMPLVDGALIFDYSQFMDVRRTDVDLPATEAREFRIMVDKLTSEQESQLLELSRSLKGGAEDGRTEKTTIQRRPFRIDRIEFWNEQAEEIFNVVVVQPWAVSDLKVTQDPEHKQTLAEFSSRREPLTALKVVTSSRNFSRRAEVQIETDSATGSKWKTIAEATISKFQLRDFHEEHVTIDLPETRHEHFRVVINNGDSPEIPIDSIEATGHRYEVVFLRQPDQIVQLAYGSESADSPEHDTVALTTALAKKIKPVAATLGVPSKILSAAQRPADIKRLLNNPFVLGAVIAVLVTVLGWGLYQASRRIDQMPRGDSE